MKKFNCFIAALLCLVSCNNQTELSMEVPVEKKSNFETFAIYGEVHNSLLQYVAENFNEPEVDPASLDEALDYVLEIQMNGVDEFTRNSM